MNILITQGRLIDASQQLDQVQDLYISAGKIVGMGAAPQGFQPDQTLDAEGKWVLPGLVDLCARLREPGSEYKATLLSELRAAMAGGVTSLACPPDTDPVLDEPGLVEMLKHRAKSHALAHVYPLGAVTRQLEGHLLTEMFALTAAGCVGFSQADTAIVDTQVLWRAFEYAATFGYTLFMRAEDPYLAKNGVAHDGEVASRLGLKGIPAAAESIALQTMLRIAQATGAKLHIARVSTAESVELLRQAKQAGMVVTADVSIQHLHLTDMDIGFFDSMVHLKPPVRTQRDRDALRAGLLDGTLDAICSDHTPVDDDAKALPFAESHPGASALELLLPLTLKWSAQAKLAPLQALAKVTQIPARILGVNAGTLQTGATADVVIYDPEMEWRVDGRALLSQGKNTPFVNHSLTGKVTATITQGNLVFQQETVQLTR
ncbi:dihydroorotase [Methylophilus sp. VKM B-3414]|uniref:dihydroorotase n=1 Tax=Methylophilus sp. VKM B-3414 TaxID=3076121 RepID=UPI0028C7BC8E|nr:dihydroorotase [Methylophilus sp. VKM B-3414]MDT7849424.1 dihydroorotase [Methylophilus sp. VKM B-3414]